MLRFQQQLLFGDILANGFTSQVFQLSGYNNFTLAVSAAAAPQGTSPTLTWAVQTSSDGINFSQVGAALPNMTSSLLQQSADYSATTVQGAITGPYFRIVAVQSAGSAWGPMYADIMAQV